MLIFNRKVKLSKTKSLIISGVEKADENLKFFCRWATNLQKNHRIEPRPNVGTTKSSRHSLLGFDKMSFKIEKGSYTNTLDSASLSGNQTITLPNATGTVVLTNQLAKVATSGSYNDLLNKPSIPSTPQGYITQTWRSGNNWYRVYSDGWIEQGGVITGHNVSGDYSINKAYTSTSSWWLQCTSQGPKVGGDNYSLVVHAISTSKFQKKGENATGFMWYAYGY